MTMAQKLGSAIFSISRFASRIGAYKTASKLRRLVYRHYDRLYPY